MARTRTLLVWLAVCLLTAGCWAQGPAGSLSLSEGAINKVSGTWQGRVETLVLDNFQTGTSRNRYFLRSPQGTMELNGVDETTVRAGQTVLVSGQTTGNQLAVTQVTTAATAQTSSCSPMGAQNIAIILVSFPSKALLSSVTPTLISSGFFGSGATLESFLRESSFGQTWLTGDVLGPYVLDGDYFDQPLAARDSALRAAAPHTDLTKYAAFFIVGPQDAMGMDSGGMALIGCGQIPSPQGTLTAASAWLGAESMITQSAVASTAEHEMGHGFGLEHARFADYGTEALGPLGQAPAPWDQLHDYGDSFSSMGRNSGQWAAPHKAQLGWLVTGTNLQNVSATGTYVLPPYEQPGSGQVIRVRRLANANAWLWVEYRQSKGQFDSTLATSAFSGALVHYEDPTLTATKSGESAGIYTNLLNFHPAIAYANDPTLHAGESWSDPYGNLSLTVNSASSSGLSVSVSYAAASVCPTSVGGAQAFTAAGGTGQIAVTAASACAWTPSTSASWITLTASNAKTGNGTVGFTVTANTATTPRWSKITIGGAFVVVTQAGAVGSLTLSPQLADIPASGGTGQITVSTSAPDYAWSYMPNASWITNVDCSCFMTVGSATLNYTVAVNPGAQRTGTITVGGTTFTVTQAGGGTNAGGVTWTLLTNTNSPTSRLNFGMAPWGHSGQAILYGGNYNTTRLSDTWLWNGSDWTQLHPAANPGIVAGHAMVYDEARGQIVLFGGMAGTPANYGNQTWIWNGTNWTQMKPATVPPAREGQAMAYDAVAQKVVMFGGYGMYAEMNDTWTWDGTNWTQMKPATSPLVRTGAKMAFDAMHGQTILFGGNLTGTPAWYADTWIWDGSNWTQMVVDAPPPARENQAMAYVPALQTVVMVGGTAGKQVTSPSNWYYEFLRDTWAWNGAAWVQWFPAVQPGPAYNVGIFYDDLKKGLTLHLGDNLRCTSRGPQEYLLTGSSAANVPVAGFRMATSVTSVTAAQGGSVLLGLTTSIFNQFNASLTLSVSGLPKGATATFAPANIAAPGSGNATLTLAAASTLPTGVYNLSVTATGAGVTKTQPVTLTVQPPPSFSLTPSATSVKAVQGASATVKFTTAGAYGFQGMVTLSVSGVPKGVTASFSPGSIASPGSGSSTLTVVATATSTSGISNITVTAAGGGVIKTQTLNLTVVPPPTFSLTPSATSVTVVQSASATVKLTTAALYNFQSPIALAVSGLPKGVTATFAPTSIASPGTGSSTLTLAATTAATAGAYSLTMTATGGVITKTQTLTLTVVPPPTFSLTLAAAGVTVAPGASGTVRISTAALYGFQAQLALSAGGLPKGVTVTFTPASIATPGTGASTLTLAVAKGTAAGTSKLTLTATGGGVTQTQTLTLVMASASAK